MKGHMTHVDTKQALGGTTKEELMFMYPGQSDLDHPSRLAPTDQINSMDAWSPYLDTNANNLEAGLSALNALQGGDSALMFNALNELQCSALADSTLCQPQPHQQAPTQQGQTPSNMGWMDSIFPPTPPNMSQTPTQFQNLYCTPVDRLLGMRQQGITPPSYSSRSDSASSQEDRNVTSPIRDQYVSLIPSTKGRRRSAADFPVQKKSTNRRRASHPSVASIVSLTAHEPVVKFINGIEHITFLYSHDRMVKEYTVRTDIESVCVDDIPIEFRLQNSIYPRANVDKEDYDGNRWIYETSCNTIGWEICWLNREKLFGRRGLIQRAVDSYRNRHPEMRSRRVARQEKVANGTLRKRRAKRDSSSF